MDKQSRHKKYNAVRPVVNFRVSPDEYKFIETITKEGESVNQAIARIFREAIKSI